MKNSNMVVEALAAELQEKAKLATHYKHLIDTAKTELKRKIYRKKLKKNNEAAVELLTALERVTEAKKRRESNDTQSQSAG